MFNVFPVRPFLSGIGCLFTARMKCVVIHVLITFVALRENSAKPLSGKDLSSTNPLEEKNREAAPHLCHDTHLQQRHRFSLKPQHMGVKAGDSVLFHCDAAEAGGNENIRWIKSDQVIWSNGCWHVAGLDRYYVFGNGTLQIRDATKTDGGTYECSMAGRMDSAPLSYLSYSLRVHNPPHASKPSSSKQNVTQNTGTSSASPAPLLVVLVFVLISTETLS
ncbi:uncharacterized protein LOC135383630 isoform X1 [Ornithodoros turicata]|uniref:uncharacterized protein LOC135383630 isoform X1 n=1 Tax=Ornithodoros turicata TaxID=34597 RepID=UPI00313883BF